MPYRVFRVSDLCDLADAVDEEPRHRRSGAVADRKERRRTELWCPGRGLARTTPSHWSYLFDRSELEIDMSVLDNRNLEPGNVAMTSTERSRITRERRRRGLRLVPVEILNGEVNWLVDVGLLPTSERDDPRKIGRAIERLLERSTCKSN